MKRVSLATQTFSAAGGQSGDVMLKRPLVLRLDTDGGDGGGDL